MLAVCLFVIYKVYESRDILIPILTEVESDSSKHLNIRLLYLH